MVILLIPCFFDPDFKLYEAFLRVLEKIAVLNDDERYLSDMNAFLFYIPHTEFFNFTLILLVNCFGAFLNL